MQVGRDFRKPFVVHGVTSLGHVCLYAGTRARGRGCLELVQRAMACG